MSESKMREEFEAWHERTLALLIGTKQHALARKMRNHKDLALLAWQASREALEQSTVSPEVLAMLKQFEADENAEMQRAETFIRETGRASISAMQRNFKIGYEKACRLMDKLVERGIVSPIDAEGRRTVLPVKVSQ